MLAAAGLLTLRTGVFARWIGMALVGAVSFLITFLASIQGTSEDSVFGYGFLPGILALAIWSIATSLGGIPRGDRRPLVRSTRRRSGRGRSGYRRPPLTRDRISPRG